MGEEREGQRKREDSWNLFNFPTDWGNCPRRACIEAWGSLQSEMLASGLLQESVLKPTPRLPGLLGLNSGLPHCRWIPYQLSHQGSLWSPQIALFLWILHNMCCWGEKGGVEGGGVGARERERDIWSWEAFSEPESSRWSWGSAGHQNRLCSQVAVEKGDLDVQLRAGVEGEMVWIKAFLGLFPNRT